MAQACCIGIQGSWPKRGSHGEIYANAEFVDEPTGERVRGLGELIRSRWLVTVGIEVRPRRAGSTGLAYGSLTPAQARILARQLEREADKAERM
jgi:hypothetical protein